MSEPHKVSKGKGFLDFYREYQKLEAENARLKKELIKARKLNRYTGGLVQFRGVEPLEGQTHCYSSMLR